MATESSDSARWSICQLGILPLALLPLACQPTPPEGLTAPNVADTPQSAFQSQSGGVVGQTPDNRYFATHLSGHAYTAHNPGQRFDIGVSNDGVTVRPTQSKWGTTRFKTARVTCNDQPISLASDMPWVEKNRFEFHHPTLVEWYENSPAGLEHGYTLSGDGACLGTLTFALEWSGDLHPALTKPGLVHLQNAAGRSVLGYSGLHALDASGATLPTSLGVEGSTVVLRVDAEKAVYPISVDPLIWTEQGILLASDGQGADRFGYSIAASGNTMVVGAPYDNDVLGDDTGAAYVFELVNGAWTEQAKLVASDLQPGALFWLVGGHIRRHARCGCAQS